MKIKNIPSVMTIGFFLQFFMSFFSCQFEASEGLQPVGSDSGRAGGAVTFYLTNADGSAKFAQQSSLSWTTAGNSNPAITLNTGTTYQSIDGFGWTLTEGSAEVIQGCSQKTALLNDLFGSGGIGVSVLRISIGASDLSSSCYSYDDTSGDTSLSRFSLNGPDLTYLIPCLKSILAINPNLKLLAVPWSAPSWMKTNASWVGGSLNASYWQTYANYFKLYLDAMKAQGISIWGICPQNEPLNLTNMPSMGMSESEQTTFINGYLGPTLRNAGYSTKIICYDHNCDNTSYPINVSNNASSYVDGAAFHLYAGSISALTTYHNSTGKNVYFTEQYTGSTGSFSGDFPWHMQNVMLGTVNNWGKIALEWNLAANSSNGPYTSGGCSTCLPGVTVTGSSYTKNVSYYIVAHMSKFVNPGAVRVGSTTTDSGLLNAAFLNGTTATVVVFNASGGSRTFNISHGGSWVTATLNANSAGTFSWTTSGTATSTPATAATATATWTAATTATPTRTPSTTATPTRTASVTATPAPTAAATASPVPTSGAGFSGSYKIVARSSGKALDVSNASTGDGAWIQQWTYFANANQKWRIVSLGTGYYNIVSVSSGKALDVQNNSLSDGALIQQWTYFGNLNQQWVVTALGTGYYRILSRSSGKSLDVQNNSTADGAWIQQWTSTGATNQQWQIVSVQ